MANEPLGRNQAVKAMLAKFAAEQNPPERQSAIWFLWSLLVRLGGL